MAKNIAQLMVDTLVQAGVERVYGLPGDSLNGFTDSIRKQKKLQWIHVRHEETAAFAAGAEAHLTGRLAVCAGSCGPGNMHLVNGLYDCHRSRVPVLALAAQIPSNEIGSGYFQETDPAQLFAKCSHYCELVSHPEQMPRVLEIAMQTAIAKRGVAVVTIPGDVSLLEAGEQQPRVKFREFKTHVRPSDEEIALLAKVLNESERVTILGGAGCAGAHAELIELAGKLNAPIVHALRGKEFIEYDNPFDVGMTGLLGFTSGYHAMMNCTTLLMIGTDFPYQQFFPKDATIVQIDLRGEQLGRRTKLDYGFVGDTKATLQALLPKLKQNAGDKHLKQSVEPMLDLAALSCFYLKSRLFPIKAVEDTYDQRHTDEKRKTTEDLLTRVLVAVMAKMRAHGEPKGDKRDQNRQRHDTKSDVGIHAQPQKQTGEESVYCLRHRVET